MAEFTTTITKTVNCPECASEKVVMAGTHGGERRYLCRGCKTWFRAGGKSKGRRVAAEQIGAAIRMYYSGTSYKQVAVSIATSIRPVIATTISPPWAWVS